MFISSQTFELKNKFYGSLSIRNHFVSIDVINISLGLLHWYQSASVSKNDRYRNNDRYWIRPVLLISTLQSVVHIRYPLLSVTNLQITFESNNTVLDMHGVWRTYRGREGSNPNPASFAIGRIFFKMLLILMHFQL